MTTPTPTTRIEAIRATYNITTNRFKLYFAEGDRLPADEYKEARSLKIVFYHGQKCFSAIYSPRVEDFILRYIDEIEEDDTLTDTERKNLLAIAAELLKTSDVGE